MKNDIKDGFTLSLSDAEKDAIMACCNIAKTYGYGNIIAHIKTEWVEFLLREHPELTEEQASKLTSVKPYSIEERNKLLRSEE